MTTFSETSFDPAAAITTVETLRAAGPPERDVRFLIGIRAHDLRSEPVGGFAGAVAPDDRVGTFASIPRLRWQGASTFAGDSDGQRHGSFADVEPALLGPSLAQPVCT